MHPNKFLRNDKIINNKKDFSADTEDGWATVLGEKLRKQ